MPIVKVDDKLRLVQIIGRRCRAVQQIGTNHGLIRCSIERVIRFESENHGSEFIKIHKGSGVIDYAFFMEVAILAKVFAQPG